MKKRMLWFMLIFTTFSFAQKKVEEKEKIIFFEKIEALPDDIYPLLAKDKIIWLGEMHGSREVPSLLLSFFRLIKKHDKTPIVALEWPDSLQKHVDHFLKTGDLEPLFSHPSFYKHMHDGRSSEAMVELLKKLREEKVEKIHCFDTDLPIDREKFMYESLLNFTEKNTFSKIILLSGNVHSRTDMGTPWDSQYKSAAFLLKQKIPSLRSFLTEASKGQIWMCWNNEPCGPQNVGTSLNDHPKHFISFKAREAHMGFIYSPQFSPSFPAVKSK